MALLLKPQEVAGQVRCSVRKLKDLPILAVHQSRERMKREEQLLCETDPAKREVLEAFAGAEVTDVRPIERQSAIGNGQSDGTPSADCPSPTAQPPEAA